VVKEKATVRKKRVSRTEAKAEESDSSDLDLKEAAVTTNKNSSPKNSRFGPYCGSEACCFSAELRLLRI
jgi:hypothetical protein